MVIGRTWLGGWCLARLIATRRMGKRWPKFGDGCGVSCEIFCGGWQRERVRLSGASKW